MQYKEYSAGGAELERQHNSKVHVVERWRDSTIVQCRWWRDGETVKYDSAGSGELERQ